MHLQIHHCHLYFAHAKSEPLSHAIAIPFLNNNTNKTLDSKKRRKNNKNTINTEKNDPNFYTIHIKCECENVNIWNLMKRENVEHVEFFHVCRAAYYFSRSCPSFVSVFLRCCVLLLLCLIFSLSLSFSPLPPLSLSVFIQRCKRTWHSIKIVKH